MQIVAELLFRYAQFRCGIMLSSSTILLIFILIIIVIIDNFHEDWRKIGFYNPRDIYIFWNMYHFNDTDNEYWVKSSLSEHDGALGSDLLMNNVIVSSSVTEIFFTTDNADEFIKRKSKFSRRRVPRIGSDIN